MIYFDNAATSYPKPPTVAEAMSTAVTLYGGNPGRSGHTLSMQAAQAMFAVRLQAAQLFGAQEENVAFTLNCTHALNLAIKGIMQGSGHIITSDLEHNSVIRPIHALSQHGCSYSVAEVVEDDEQTVHHFRRLIKPETKAIACTMTSNVTGQVLPFRAIGALCKERNICFIADGAQACGVIPIDLQKDNINILCMPGHKGLFGPTGTGLLITDGVYPLAAVMEGGTGSNSFDVEQPTFMPDVVESGTPNVIGAVGLGAGLRFVKKLTIPNIHAHESALCRVFVDKMSKINGVVLYGAGVQGHTAPIVPFNVKGYTSEEVTAQLSDAGFALRGGLHCSHMAHKKLGTLDGGVVRFAPSVMNQTAQVHCLCEKVRQIASGRK